jgi:hypothetical protein
MSAASHAFLIATGVALAACGSSAPSNTNNSSTDASTAMSGGDAFGGGQRPPASDDGGQSPSPVDTGTGTTPTDGEAATSNDAQLSATDGGSDSASSPPDAATPDGHANSGLYSCTFNATGAYPLGAEHRGYVIFGTVVDTTPGANRARVGAFQNALDTNDQIKFVWPGILTLGHTYEIALFEDYAKNRTCAGDPLGNEAQWLFPVPAVTGDFTFNFTHNPRMASCQDFPTGPIP